MFFKSIKKIPPNAELDAQETPATPLAQTPEPADVEDQPMRALEASLSGAAANGHDQTAAPESDQAPEQPPQLTPEELRNRAAQSKHMAASLGGIVSIFMRAKEFKGMTLGQLEHMVVPAVVTRQFMIAEAQSKQNGMTAPVATVLWASVSEEVDQRLSRDLDKPVTLDPKDWKSGDIPWLIVIAGDQRLIGGMLKKLQSEVFKDRSIKLRSRDKDGQTTVTTVQAE